MADKIAYERLNKYREAMELVCIHKSYISTSYIEAIDCLYVELKPDARRLDWSCNACITERIYDAYRLLLNLNK